MAKFCSECGSQLKEGGRFCASCGAAVLNPVQLHVIPSTPSERLSGGGGPPSDSLADLGEAQLNGGGRILGNNSSPVEDTAPVPADWYEDPDDPSRERYWNGTRWTEHIQRDGVPVTVEEVEQAPTYYPTFALRPSFYKGRARGTGADPGWFSKTGIILGACAVLFVPIILGPAAIIFGAIGTARDEPLGGVAILVGIVGLLVGLWFGYAVAVQNYG